MVRSLAPFLLRILALGVVAVLGVRQLATTLRDHRPAASSASPAAAPGARQDRVVLQADRSGHFVTDAQVEGMAVRAMVDTGATVVALTSRDAQSAGIAPIPGRPTARISTANGAIEVAPARIREIRIGGVIVRDVEAVIVPADRLGISLLGMSFLRRLDGYAVEGSRLTMRN